MLPIFEKLRIMANEAKAISEAINQLCNSLENVSGNKQQELDVLDGFLYYYTKKLLNNNTPLSLLKADAQQMLAELDTAIQAEKDCLSIKQQALQYRLTMDALHTKLFDICLTLAD